MNQIQRDTVQRLLPQFRTVGFTGRGDKDLSTAQLKPGAYLEKKFDGYTLPTFDDLLLGLTRLPQGSDARSFTQCLEWYLEARDTFTPRLELNVLHAQALIRALKSPNTADAAPNLNKLALLQWRKAGRFAKTPITAPLDINTHKTDARTWALQDSKPRTVLTIGKESMDLEMHINLPIRHVLIFPLLALHGVIAEALKTGIDRSERRRAAREYITSMAS